MKASDSLSLRLKEFKKKQILFSAFSFIFLNVVAVFLNQLHMDSLAEETTNYLIRHIRLGDKREVTLMLNQAHLSNFKTIRYHAKNQEQSFTIPARADLDKESDLDLFLFGKVQTEVQSIMSTSSGDQIIYEYRRFRLIPYAIVVWVFVLLMSIPQINYLKRKILEQLEKDIEIEKSAFKQEVTREVRHNLRTPLAALMRVPQQLPIEASEEKELLDVIIRQIQDLLGKLDDGRNKDLHKEDHLSIYDTLLSARQEIKGIIPKNIDFKFDIEDMVCANLVRHVPFELRALLSNMVANSLDSIQGGGAIGVNVYETANSVVIKVSDTGRGIEPDIIHRIFEKDFTHNKNEGSGIGLYHAKSFITEWNGDIQVESMPGIGTIFTIRLPIYDKASWYVSGINLLDVSQIYVLDDQQSALTLWRQKLFETSYLDKVKFLNKPDDFRSTSNEWNSRSIFFVDYDLGSNTSNGLELLASAPEKSIRCLVTGHFDDIEIRAKCTDLGIYLIPKSSIKDLDLNIRG